MLDEESKSGLKQLLAEGKMEEVIEKLKKGANKNLLNALTVISNEFQKNKKHEFLNTKPQNEISVQNNRLIEHLLAIIDEENLAVAFKGQTLEKNSDFSFNLNINKNVIRIIIIGIVIILIAYAIFLFFVIKEVDNPAIILGIFPPGYWRKTTLNTKEL